jgi:hypothetical protein
MEDQSAGPWVLVLPRLSRGQAEQLLALAEGCGISYGASLLDPREFLTLYLDKTTARWLANGLAEETLDITSDDGGTSPSEARTHLANVGRECVEFLEGN